MTRIIVTVNPLFDLRYTALLFAGLAQHGHLEFRFDDAIEVDSFVHLEIHGKKIVVDLWDHADRYDEPGLAWCDLYLKRSLIGSREKVVPFGLNYAARGTVSAWRAAIASRDWRRSLNMLRRAHSSAYEMKPQEPVDNVVMLQTRLWEEDECPGDFAINEQRIELVSSLKAALGDKFRGGLIDTALARKLAPSLIGQNPTKQRDYIRWQKSCKVGVYTRGLFGSMGFKMAEYLASSKCIVSEPIPTRLPTPLVNGEHVLIYQSPQECIEHCREMLASPNTFRENTWRYYTDHVRLAADGVRTIMAASNA